MSRYIAKMNLIAAVQRLLKKDVECVQDYVELIEDENTELKQKEENFIKYLEDKIKEPVSYNLLYDGKQQAYKDILERLKSGKYE